MVWLLLVVACATLAVGAPVVWRGLQMRQLALRGVRVTGKFVRRLATGKPGGISRSRRLVFSYTGPDGREYRSATSVTAAVWERYRDGDSIDIVCLPDRPAVCAQASMVEAARVAVGPRV
jgi:hypothetical protein